MKNGIEKFEFFLIKLNELLLEATQSDNPALFLYKNDARTPLFMLEGLSRMYSSLHNKKKFEEIKDHFKLLEDTIGAIDYYDNFAISFSKKTSIPSTIVNYMRAQTELKLAELNDVLIQNDWLEKKKNRIDKIRKELSKLDWLSQKKETAAIKKKYINEIESIKKFIQKNGNPYTELENHVHEVRRDMRWLSIYPHALQGQIQLTYREGSEKITEKYLLPEVVNSKFNRFPTVGGNAWVLLLEKNYFYALSWMIAEFGKWKDQGLEYLALVDALQKTEALNEVAASEKAYQYLAIEPNTISKILSYTSVLSKQFIKDQILDNLIYGIARIERTI